MTEHGQFFLPEIARNPGRKGLYLEGYLQSPRYFSSIEATLRTELSFPIEADAIRQYRITDASGAVSIHIRRRDYSRVLSVEYYQRAVDLVRAQISQPAFFVFGDDMVWAAQELSWLEPKILVRTPPPNDDVKDLALMSACRHHILANSTFSWWAAWLGQTNGGLIIAPALGWSDSHGCPRDLFPDGWTLL
jgi:hypothetical protein